ncbi:hypothetical protein [Myceligenerans pegani]|uniref:Uncharacterized protein n=1 Tax=Myceligenerans pegani TaxID=2776917 RepID=A0ABR9N6F0_9MICO|nr:hypothetical protein [Myceligenerans sp. TRM 65318]MBE1878846.1 hypothetical protein [Myceligenerans sp. TRM 65318]MBE3021117.1 hypothetical protein [Myceligenerans sp. TRM 65318]
MTPPSTAPLRAAAPLPALPSPDRWHRPLVGLAVTMAALTVATAVLAIVDPREILGQNAWFKPLKFALSIGIYAVTLAWLIGRTQRFRRTADTLGTATAVALLVEIAVIAGAAAAGTTSHFNIATPLNATLWATMGASIIVVWVATLVVGIAVALDPGPDAARNLAVRAGVVLGLVGMGLAFLMTTPNADQIDDFQGIAGAHAVGVADGGPGLPFLGWSTEGGDLRIPHFFGLHALQAIPLGLLALELLARGIAPLRDSRVRSRLVLVGALAFAATIGILTWQALAGESIVRPSAPTLAAGAATVVGTLVAAGAVLVTGTRSAGPGSPRRTPTRPRGPRPG